ncbi:MAG: MBOAT family protein [Clostridia bacterium]|nr:MBOAT family protein [Clostridia bacterium]
MIFSSTLFLFLFLPLVLLIYYAIPKKFLPAKNIVLLIASLIFYAWGEPLNIVLMILSIVCNYIFGLAIGISKNDAFARKVVLVISLIYNLGLLFFFKYFNFVTGNVFEYIALPIGISFFTFQIMSYTIDVYLKNCKPQKNLFDLGLYISLFPQLIAGPIVRYIDVNDELACRDYNLDKIFRGVSRFIMGLAKKVLVSNTVALLADTIFAIDRGLNSATAWLGIIAYALQIYYDFSGYSDMAIGLGHMLGFNFLENFNYPYISKSVQEFWRRWHISLSTWFRDYLYIPLGGNRKGKVRTYVNLLIVFFCTGLWHGASFNFIVWGLFYGFFLILERLFLGKLLQKIPAFIGHFYTLIVALVGWVFFRADDLEHAIAYLGAMFNFGNFGLVRAAAQLDNLTGIIMIAAIIFSAPLLPWLRRKLISISGGNELPALILNVAGCIMLLLTSIVFLTGSDYNPFIYFRF